MPRAVVHLALGALVAAPLMASSAPARAGNEAAAEALFVEAKKLVAQGKVAKACPKFAESNRLDRGAGTMIHLADCYEKNKQTASAWATYREAASAAQALGRADWERLATARASGLEPKLAKVTIGVASPVDRIEVKRDDAQVSQASWGVPVPVDIGTHRVAVSAPGFKPFETTFAITKDGETKDIPVPRLAAEAAAATPTPAPPSSTSRRAEADTRSADSTQKTIGFVVAGAGVVAVGVGAVTGLMAKSRIDTAKQDCPSDGPCASRSAVDATDSGKRFGAISTIAFAAGGVALVSGVVLILTSPSSAAGLRVVPSAGPSTASLALSGAF